MEGNENFEGQKEKSLCKYCVAGGPGNVSYTNNPKTEGISMDMRHNFLFTERFYSHLFQVAFPRG